VAELSETLQTIAVRSLSGDDSSVAKIDPDVSEKSERDAVDTRENSERDTALMSNSNSDNNINDNNINYNNNDNYNNNHHDDDSININSNNNSNTSLSRQNEWGSPHLKRLNDPNYEGPPPPPPLLPAPILAAQSRAITELTKTARAHSSTGEPAPMWAARQRTNANNAKNQFNPARPGNRNPSNHQFNPLQAVPSRPALPLREAPRLSEDTLHIVVPLMELIDFPCIQGQNIKDSFHSLRLIKEKIFNSHRPDLARTYLNILVVGKHTLITLRTKCRGESGKRVDEQKVSLDTFLHRVWEGLATTAASPRRDDRSLQGAKRLAKMNARTAAIHILKAARECNMKVLYRLNRWRLVVETAMQTQVHMYHSAHLKRIGELSSVFDRESRQVAKLWDSTSSRASAFSDNMISNLFGRSARKLMYIGNLFKSIVQDCKDMKERSDLFYTTLARHQEEQNNRRLYLLTVVSTMAMPMQLSTGIYGMNFDVMPELGFKYSYLIFWLVNLVVLFLIFRYFKQQASFDF
jgi:Mg2+ and Co2+ transporter CorA